jgi:hypothetical protein
MRALVGTRVRASCALGVGLACVLASSQARAQPIPQLWRPSTDANASMVLEPTATPGPGNWNLGLWGNYAHYGSKYCCLEIRRLQDPAHVVLGDLVTGIGIGSRFAIGLGVSSHFATYASGKATLIANDHGGIASGFGLALKANVFLGDTIDDDAGSQNFTWEGDVLGEFALGVGAIRAQLGYQGGRYQEPVFGDYVSVPAAPNPSLQDFVPWALGLDVRPKLFSDALDNGDRQLWELAFHGAFPGRGALARGDTLDLFPVIASLDDRVALGHYREFFVTAGAAIGVDGAAGVPVYRFVAGLGWAPRSHDKDGDGIDDDADQCPDLPEDRDGLQDADGCPEDDADGDSILDTDDACPLVAGVPSDDKKKNGCPP